MSRTIKAIDVWPVDVPLVDPFVISRGVVASAEIAFVRVQLAGGVEGFGEIAPFGALTPETRDASVAAARRLSGLLIGRDAADDTVDAEMRAHAPGEPAARAGLECALVDAVARAADVPLWRHWGFAGGSQPPPVVTDITLPILDDERVFELCADWHGRGFRTLKLKVGIDAARDRDRVLGIAQRFADVDFILDANQGYATADGAAAFVESLGQTVSRVRLLEQPLPREDLAGMSALRKRVATPVAADESVLTADDARRVVEQGAADVINLKIMKSGLRETFAIAGIARDNGVGLMIGGMVETRLAMGFSLAFVVGVGGVTHVDLDTPLLLAEDPVRGGFTYAGPEMLVSADPGTGATPRALPSRNDDRGVAP